MIEAVVTQIDLRGNDIGVIINRTFSEPNLSLQDVLTKMEQYIKEEEINQCGECNIKVIFSNLHNTNARK